MSIPIWNAVNKLAQHAEELAGRVERLEERNQDELANWRNAGVRQCEIERRLVRLEHLASTTHFVLDTSAMPESKREQLLQSLKEPGRVERLEQAQQQPAPSTPAGQGELASSVDRSVIKAARAGRPVAPAAILAVADWCDDRGMDLTVGDLLRREVGR